MCSHLDVTAGSSLRCGGVTVRLVEGSCPRATGDLRVATSTAAGVVVGGMASSERKGGREARTAQGVRVGSR
jgi:hydrogenase maturation factor HypE